MYDVRVTRPTYHIALLGVGIVTIAVTVKTLESLPSAPPSNLRVLNQTSTSIEIAWDGIPVERMHGVLLGYRVAYGLLGIPGSNASLVQIDVAEPDTYQQTLTGLRKYSSYWITVTGFTSIGDGPVSEPVNATTDQHVPSSPPSNVRANVNGSTSIQVDWDKVPSPLVHGILMGYLVTYRKSGTGVMAENETAPGTTSILLTGLQPYFLYDIQVSAFTVKGCGPQSVPSVAPTIIKAANQSSTSLTVQWSRIPPGLTRGVLLGYRVTYTQYDSGATYTRDTAAGVTRMTLTSLTPYMVYTVSVAGFTSKGTGPESYNITLSTDEDVPIASPIHVQAANQSSTSLRVRWGPVPGGRVHDVLLGYHVTYRQVNGSWFRSDVTKERELVLSGLQVYTVYSVRVAAYTRMGDGPASPEVIART
ncbi:predicted protein, partial [Nematostella vectensis]